MPERRKPESKNCPRALIRTSLGHHPQNRPKLPLAGSNGGRKSENSKAPRVKGAFEFSDSTPSKFEGESRFRFPFWNSKPAFTFEFRGGRV